MLCVLNYSVHIYKTAPPRPFLELNFLLSWTTLQLICISPLSNEDFQKHHCHRKYWNQSKNYKTLPIHNICYIIYLYYICLLVYEQILNIIKMQLRIKEFDINNPYNNWNRTGPENRNAFLDKHTKTKLVMVRSKHFMQQYV